MSAELHKIMVVGFAAAVAPDPDAATRLLDALDPLTYPRVTLQVTDEAATAQWQRRSRPAAQSVAAILSVWTTDSGAVATARDHLVPATWSHHAICVVDETVVRDDPPSPTVVVTSLLHRHAGMTRDEFSIHWRDVHQPMSLRIHPQHTYVRNVVTDDLVPATPAFDAVSEEGFTSVDDVLDPSRFFGADGAPDGWRENARVIGDDVVCFLDTEHTTATIMRPRMLRDGIG